MTTAITQQGVGVKIGLGTLPEECDALPITVNFTNDTTFFKDLVQEQANLKIPYLQSVYIDNSANPNAFTLTFGDAIAQNITVKGHTQGWYLLAAAAGPPRITMTSTQGAVAVNLIFVSVMVPPVQWATQ